MNLVRRTLASMALVALVALWPATAMAAPTPWSLVEVAMHTEQSGGIMLVSGELPAGTTLPAEAELSVPKGMQVQWIGQILGGEPANDPTLQYTKTTVGEADVYRFTMTKSLIAQMELPVTTAVAFNGTDYDVALKWVASQDLAEVRLMAQIPQPATVMRPSEGAVVQPVTANAAYYTKTVTNVKAGDALDLTFGYSVPAGAAGTVTPGSTAAPAVGTPAAPTATPASAGPELPIAIALALLSAFVVGYFVLQSRRTTAPAPEPASQPSRATPASTSGAKRAVVEPDEDEYEYETEEPTKMDAKTKRTLITVAIVAAFILVGVVVGSNATKPQVSSGQIVQTFDGGAPCATVVVPVDAAAAGGPEKAAEALFAALGTAQGINDASFDIASSQLTVGYCSTTTNEGAVRGVLGTTGIVTQ